MLATVNVLILRSLLAYSFFSLVVKVTRFGFSKTRGKKFRLEVDWFLKLTREKKYGS